MALVEIKEIFYQGFHDKTKTYSFIAMVLDSTYPFFNKTKFQSDIKVIDQSTDGRYYDLIILSDKRESIPSIHKLGEIIKVAGARKFIVDNIEKLFLQLDYGGSFILFNNKYNLIYKKNVTITHEEKIGILSLKKWSCRFISSYNESFTPMKELLNSHFKNTIAKIKWKSLSKEDEFLSLLLEDNTFKAVLTVKNKNMSLDWYETLKEDDIVKIKTIKRNEKEFELTEFSNILVLPLYSNLYQAFLKTNDKSSKQLNDSINCTSALFKREDYLMKSEDKLKKLLYNSKIQSDESPEIKRSDSIAKINQESLNVNQEIFKINSFRALSKREYILSRLNCIIKYIDDNTILEKLSSKQMYEFNSRIDKLREFTIDFKIFTIFPERTEDIVKIFCGNCLNLYEK